MGIQQLNHMDSKKQVHQEFITLIQVQKPTLDYLTKLNAATLSRLIQTNHIYKKQFKVNLILVTNIPSKDLEYKVLHGIFKVIL